MEDRAETVNGRGVISGKRTMTRYPLLPRQREKANNSNGCRRKLDRILERREHSRERG
jgi:hypothetical protein